MPNVLRAPMLTSEGFLHGSSTRLGGVSQAPFDSLNLATSGGLEQEPEDVRENLRRFAGWVGFQEQRLFTLSQVHGAEVHMVSPAQRPSDVRALRGDALLAPPGVAVAVRSADCVPVLLADPVSRWVAAAHAGWRGVVAGVVTRAVHALSTIAGAPPGRLYAGVFPHVRACCFEVDVDVARALSQAHPGDEACVIEARDAVGKPHVDLDVIVRAQLTAAAVEPARTDSVAGCTCCEPARFYSYRRDGASSGRHLTAIVG